MWQNGLTLHFENNRPPSLVSLQLSCWDCLELLPFLVHCILCIRKCHRLEHWNKFVNQMAVGHRNETFACKAIFMFVSREDSNIQSYIVLGIFWDAISRFAATFVVLARTFLWAGMDAVISLSNQFSPQMFKCFLVIWFDKVNYSVFEHCRVLASRSSVRVFSILSDFTYFRPYFWPHVIWSGSRLNLCESPPGPHVSFGKFFFQ